MLRWNIKKKKKNIYTFLCFEKNKLKQTLEEVENKSPEVYKKLRIQHITMQS